MLSWPQDQAQGLAPSKHYGVNGNRPPLAVYKLCIWTGGVSGRELVSP